MKKVFAVLMVKNEEDIIGYNIEHLQRQNIDHIFVANNLSSDRTKEILLSLSEKYGNMTVIDDTQFAYEQSKKMNKWIKECYEMGADIIVPIDADEVWYSKIPDKTLADALRDNGDGDCIFISEAIDFIPTENDLESDNPLESMIYVKANSNSFKSVAFTKHHEAVLSQGNHDVFNHPGRVVEGVIGIKHYQYRNFDQFARKMRNGKRVYDETTMPDYIGSHWRTLGAMSKDELKQWWEEYTSQPTKLYEGL